jgi:hypothetical protein
MQLNLEGKKIYEKGKLKEKDLKYELAIREYNKAEKKFKDAHSYQELEEIFNSFIKVLKGFVRTKAYENAYEVINFIEKGYYSKVLFKDDIVTQYGACDNGFC